MSRLFRPFVCLLLHLYPSEVRARDGRALVEAGLACLDRERRRIGWAGMFYAAIRLTIDAIAAAVTETPSRPPCLGRSAFATGRTPSDRDR